MQSSFGCLCPQLVSQIRKEGTMEVKLPNTDVYYLPCKTCKTLPKCIEGIEEELYNIKTNYFFKHNEPDEDGMINGVIMYLNKECRQFALYIPSYSHGNKVDDLDHVCTGWQELNMPDLLDEEMDGKITLISYELWQERIDGVRAFLYDILLDIEKNNCRKILDVISNRKSISI